MNILSLTVLLILSASASFAADSEVMIHTITARIYSGDRLISAPKVSTIDGEEVVISQYTDKGFGLTFSVKPKWNKNSQAHDFIHLNLTIERREKEKILKLASVMNVLAGEENSVYVESESSKAPLRVELKVL